MKNDTRIILRVPSEQRQQIDALIQEGRFKNLSVVVRAALKEFLEANGVLKISPILPRDKQGKAVESAGHE